MRRPRSASRTSRAPDRANIRGTVFGTTPGTSFGTALGTALGRRLAALAGSAILVAAPSCARAPSVGTDAPAATPASATPTDATSSEPVPSAPDLPPPPVVPTPASPAAGDAAPPDDAAFLARCAEAAAYSRANEGHVVLVLRDGVEVFADTVAPHTLATPHQLASGTKSFSGLAAALAVDDGFLDLDERVSDTIEEWRDDPRKSRITVRQLLSLSGGIEPLSAVLESARSAAAAGIVDRAEASIAARALDEPGARFRYGPSHFYIFGELLERKLEAAGTGDADTAAYLERRLFAPLGISVAFTRDGARHPNLPGGGRTSARDWATFGEFVRRGGVHSGDDGDERRLVQRGSLDALFVATGPNPRYGLTWWLLDGAGGNPEDEIAADLATDALAANASADEGRPLRRALRERLARRAVEASRARIAAAGSERTGGAGDSSTIRGVMAAGKGKQRLYILPEHGLVVVRFGAVEGGRGFEDARFLSLLLGDTAHGAAEPPASRGPDSADTAIPLR